MVSTATSRTKMPPRERVVVAAVKWREGILTPLKDCGTYFLIPCIFVSAFLVFEIFNFSYLKVSSPKRSEPEQNLYIIL